MRNGIRRPARLGCKGGQQVNRGRDTGGGRHDPVSSNMP
jgi:hypothetical protein